MNAVNRDMSVDTSGRCSQCGQVLLHHYPTAAAASSPLDFEISKEITRLLAPVRAQTADLERLKAILASLLLDIRNMNLESRFGKSLDDALSVMEEQT